MKGLNHSGITTIQRKAILDVEFDRVDPMEYESVQKWVEQCLNKPPLREQKMMAFNEILGGYGIESMPGEWRNGYWGNIVLTYVNMGEDYAPTIINHRDKGFLAYPLGDYVERFTKEFYKK